MSDHFSFYSCFSDSSGSPLNSNLALKANISDVKGLINLPDDTLGVNIFPGVDEKAVYICATKVNAPKTTMEKYVIEVYRDADFIVQKWYSLWFDVVYYRRCNVTGGWVWGAFKTVDMTTL